MLVGFVCVLCLQEGHPISSAMDLHEPGLHSVVCTRGHRIHIVVENQRFDLLFDSGLSSFLDGHYREAISSVVAAFERCIEFYVRVDLEERAINTDQVEATWKLVRSQSERQLGAFLFMYLARRGSSLDFNLQRFTEFRNRVIHQGAIPSQAEAYDYCEMIYNFLRPLVDSMKVESEGSIMAITSRAIEVVAQKMKKGDVLAQASQRTALDIQGLTPVSFKGYLDYLKVEQENLRKSAKVTAAKDN